MVTVTATPTRRLVVAQGVLVGSPRREHLRVRFPRLLVRRAMDPGCPEHQPSCGSKETTLGEQGSTPPGEWNVYVDAGGTWGTWGNRLLRAHDRQEIGRAHV